MPTKNITSISLKDVRKLVNDQKIGDPALSAVNTLLDLLLAFSPALGIPPASPLLKLLNPADKIIPLIRKGIEKLSASPSEDYLNQAERMAAANCMLMHIAFFEAFSQVWPQIAETLQITGNFADEFLSQEIRKLPGENNPADYKISLPHPVDLQPDRQARRLVWGLLTTHLSLQIGTYLASHIYLASQNSQHKPAAMTMMLDEISAIAERIYQADRLGLAVDFQQFFTWTVLQDQMAAGQERDAIDHAVQTLSDDQQAWFKLIGRAMYEQDLGLQGLATAIAKLPQAVGTAIDQEYTQKAVEALQFTYTDSLNQEIITDQFDVADNGQKLQFPKKIDAFIPQAYQALTYHTNDENQNLERDETWSNHRDGKEKPSNLQSGGDIGAFIVRYLESPYSMNTPLLLLGHPGSGKSILTEMLAGQLQSPSSTGNHRYTTIRIKLRDIDPAMELSELLEKQIQKDTGGRKVEWVRFTEGLTTPPVIILDGYDELLQATGKVFTGYLQDTVRNFQKVQALQNRPVRIIVTSRLTLIDKARIPDGTTVVRLEEFDQARRTTWTEMWNQTNKSYFATGTGKGVRPFTLPDSPKLLELARQPLLLLMLALYDSKNNDLSSQPDIDQTVLYDSLLRRFIERELTKEDSGRIFREKPVAAQAKAIDKEMQRLGIAAIGMFNREGVTINKEQLNADLNYFNNTDETHTDAHLLSKAEHVFGSFFFVHESLSQFSSRNTGQDSESAAFEFLHNTFGEFLAADFILSKAIEAADLIQAYSENEVFANERAKYLTALSEPWFGSLIHMPLFTRPAILSMLREWSAQRLTGDDRQNLLYALDTLMTAQLRTTLNDLALPNPKPTQRGLSQYRSLPNRGHLAIYSLNLILLRTYIGNSEYVLDDKIHLAAPGTGCRPWDSLVNLWRSWFPLEDLNRLATWMSATRRDDQVVIKPSWAGWMPSGETRIHLAHTAGVALADDQTAAITGLHIASLESVTPEQFSQIRSRVESQIPELAPLASIQAIKHFDQIDEEIPSFDISDSSPNYIIDFLDAATKSSSTPVHLPQISLGEPSIDSIINLSRTQAEAGISASTKIDTNWIYELLEDLDGNDISRQPVQDFLASPAAAPAFRVALSTLSRQDLYEIAPVYEDNQSTLNAIKFFDIDTAVALAIFLSHDKNNTPITARILTIIIDAIENNTWNLWDIPEQTMEGFADLLRSADTEISSLRNRLSIYINHNITHEILDDILESKTNSAAFLVNVHEVGATIYNSRIYDIIYSRQRNADHQKWILRLIHRLREDSYAVTDDNASRGALTSWLSNFLDVDPEVNVAPEEWDAELLNSPPYSTILTLQQADDLRWLIGILRDSNSGS